jgi:hypothetical protein
MVVIPVKVCGDAWSNRQEVESLLCSALPQQEIVLDFLLEGASLVSIGLFDLLNTYCANTGRSKKSIKIINYPNLAEHTDYENLTNPYNHCLTIAKIYWQEPVPPESNAKKFAYFLGRRTIARSYILYDLYHNFENFFLLSSMKNRGHPPWIQAPMGINLEKTEHWMTNNEYEKFRAWYDCCPINSIDGHSVRDHYDPNQNIHTDLLQHYDKFCIELVTETYTIGNTFFPTEKTFRPLMAVRPILVYGPPNFLQRLRDMGFETWSSCWDESYDKLQGPARWQAIRQLFEHITVDQQVWDIANRNRQHLKTLVYDRKVF